MNPNLTFAPDDFFRFDFTEMGSIGGDIISTSDDWAGPSVEPLIRNVKMTDLSIRQHDIAIWWTGNVHVDVEITPFLLNWLDSRCLSDAWSIELLPELEYLMNFRAKL